MSLLIRFEDLLTQEKNRVARFAAALGELEDLYCAALLTEHVRRFPRKRKRDRDTMQDDLDWKTIQAPFLDRANGLDEQTKAERDGIAAALAGLAAQVEPPQASDMVLQTSVSSHSYMSQGYGATKYAQAAANRKADKARAAGLQAEVRVIESHRSETLSRWGGEHATYGVYANTTAVGWEIVTRKPGPSLKDWVIACHRDHVNPRVYDPFLPWDINQRLGLDNYGNEVPTEKDVSP